MKKILILFAHPAFQKSRINKLLVSGLQDLNGVTFHDLYEKYPDLDINVEHEQQLMENHDVIVFHHPFFWYSTPAILKEWQDLVLEHGWAYGQRGTALKGKWFFNTITTGGRAEAYSKNGFHGCTVRQLLLPIEKTALLCKMVFLPPFVVHGTHSIGKQEIDIYNNNYNELLTLIHEEKIDPEDVLQNEYFNDYFKKEK